MAGKGKYYMEATVTDEGLCRVGFSTPMASLGKIFAQIVLLINLKMILFLINVHHVLLKGLYEN